MSKNLDRCISATRRSHILSFLQQNTDQEYTACQIAQQIGSAFTTAYQVASAIQHMLPWDIRHININRSQHPYKYSYVN